MKRRPTVSKRSDTLFPYTTLFRSALGARRLLAEVDAMAGGRHEDLMIDYVVVYEEDPVADLCVDHCRRVVGLLHVDGDFRRLCGHRQRRHQESDREPGAHGNLLAAIFADAKVACGALSCQMTT